MRLTTTEIRSLREVAALLLGTFRSTRLWLFGSRVDDHKAGGDIDLLIELDEMIDSPRSLAREFRCLLLPLIGDRKIDIVVKTPQMTDLTFLDLIEKKKIIWQKP